MCTVWRQNTSEENEQRDLYAQSGDDPAFVLTIYGEEGQTLIADAEPLTNLLPKQRVHRQRLVLSLALLTQVCATLMVY